MSDKKLYLLAEAQLEGSFDLGMKVFKSGFRPDWILTLLRGGAPIGMAIEELFLNKGLKPRHLFITVKSYTAIGEQGAVTISGLEPFLPSSGDRVLIVDDIYDSGTAV